MKPPILVVEDDPLIRNNLVELLGEVGYSVISADNGIDGIALARARQPGLVICDIMLPKADGYAVLRALRDDSSTSSVPLIFLTAKGERAEVRLGMNLGADDYLTKPFTISEVLEAVSTRLRRHDEVIARARDAAERESASTHEATTPAYTPADGVVVLDPTMRTLYDQASRAAASAINVLILGENGVGKEILARAIHNLSPRVNGPFVALNCAALTESLVQAELFGHEKGAFTGALQARAGLLESAAGGTLFLDEIGELPLSMQSKLLRALEERKVLRIGARAEREIDVRFVAATNRDPELEIERGTFRQDLYFRLNGISLTIPPLRERTLEIPHLARMFLARARAEHAAPPLALADSTLALLQAYAWPGNVRELRNVIERGAVLCRGDRLLPEHLPPKLVSPVAAPASAPPPMGNSSAPPFGGQRPLPAAERQQILDALDRCAGNQTRAAEVLGISRRTLVTRLNEFDIPRPRKRT
jgi:two-component system, NtrC family, response regulator AtoC